MMYQYLPKLSSGLDGKFRIFGALSVNMMVANKGIECVQSGILKIHRSNLTLPRLISEQKSAEPLFLLAGDSAFFTEKEHQIPLSACMVSKLIRNWYVQTWQSKLPAKLSLSIPAPVPVTVMSAIALDPVADAHGSKRFSNLINV